MARAGKYRHRVSIAQTVEADDSHHGFSETTVPIASRIPAFVSPLSGRELERAQAIAPRTTHQVDLRHRTGVKAGQTLTFHDPDAGDRPFEIVAPPIDVGEQRRELQVLCKESEAA